MRFEDRQDGGRKLAELLGGLRKEQPLVLGLPRGGVPVAYEVARALGAPLDVLVARKLGAPGMPEYGIGAIAEGGAVYISAEAVRDVGLGPDEISAIAERESGELLRRVHLYRGDRPLPDMQGRTVILVDDGIATGGTARAAVRAVRQHRPARLVLATPVLAFQTLAELLAEVDELVYVDAPEDFIAVGVWYRHFSQTTDREVIECLERSRLALEGGQAGGGEEPEVTAAAGEREVWVPAGRLFLPGMLAVPEGPRGVVVFAHGSGSSRRSPRNRFVAALLGRRRLATLLMDLLTCDEEASPGAPLRFDVDLLAERLLAASRWLAGHPATADLPLGYFGASTGAAAALIAAAEAPERCRAVVSRGGRPDLAPPEVLERVRAPTLLLVGERDQPVVQLNRRALTHLGGERKLVLVPEASHLFEEPGALEAVAELAAGWFERFLAQPAQRGEPAPEPDPDGLGGRSAGR